MRQAWRVIAPQHETTECWLYLLALAELIFRALERVVVFQALRLEHRVDTAVAVLLPE